MTAVTVNLADLEALVFSTSVIKSIEAALAQHKRDPFAQPNTPLTEVHDRLAAAMRNARRATAGTAIAWDEPLTSEEMKVLHAIDIGLQRDDFFMLPPAMKVPEPGQAMTVIDRLAAKGCIILGSAVSGVIWPGESAVSKVTLTKDPATGMPSGYAVKITDRGRKHITEWETTASQAALEAPKEE